MNKTSKAGKVLVLVSSIALAGGCIAYASWWSSPTPADPGIGGPSVTAPPDAEEGGRRLRHAARADAPDPRGARRGACDGRGLLRRIEVDGDAAPEAAQAAGAVAR